MIRRWPAACLLLLITTASPAATPGCQFDRLPAGGERLGAWIDKGNWLAVENHRLTLQSAETFMPAATHALYDGNPRANRAEVVKSFERKPSGVPAGMLPLTTHLAAAEAILGEGKEVKYHGHIDMKTADGMIVPWLASQTDILADDWTVV